MNVIQSAVSSSSTDIRNDSIPKEEYEEELLDEYEDDFFD